MPLLYHYSLAYKYTYLHLLRGLRDPLCHRGPLLYRGPGLPGPAAPEVVVAGGHLLLDVRPAHALHDHAGLLLGLKRKRSDVSISDECELRMSQD